MIATTILTGQRNIHLTYELSFHASITDATQNNQHVCLDEVNIVMKYILLSLLFKVRKLL